MQAHRNDRPTSSPRSGSPQTGKSCIKATQRLAHRPNILRESARFALALRRSIIGNLTAVFIVANLIGAACSLPVSFAPATRSVPPTEMPASTETPASAPTPASTQTPAPAETATPEPAATPTEALLDLEILEWSEFPIANRADPANTDTRVEVLIRNPNESPVRVPVDGVELRFLNASGEVVYANPNPVFYI